MLSQSFQPERRVIADFTIIFSLRFYSLLNRKISAYLTIFLALYTRPFRNDIYNNISLLSWSAAIITKITKYLYDLLYHSNISADKKVKMDKIREIRKIFSWNTVLPHIYEALHNNDDIWGAQKLRHKKIFREKRLLLVIAHRHSLYITSVHNTYFGQSWWLAQI